MLAILLSQIFVSQSDSAFYYFTWLAHATLYPGTILDFLKNNLIFGGILSVAFFFLISVLSDSLSREHLF